MTKQEPKLLDYLDASAAYWQYRHNPAENENKQPHEQAIRNRANQNTDDTWIMLLGILGTIVFLVLLAIKTI
jgi:hypothetical protein